MKSSRPPSAAAEQQERTCGRCAQAVALRHDPATMACIPLLEYRPAAHGGGCEHALFPPPARSRPAGNGYPPLASPMTERQAHMTPNPSPLSSLRCPRCGRRMTTIEIQVEDPPHVMRLRGCEECGITTNELAITESEGSLDDPGGHS